MLNFVNNGTDEEILKSLPLECASDELIKAMGRQGLVQKEVQVRTKNGVITRKQWVRASQDQPADKPMKKDSTVTTSNGTKIDKNSLKPSDEIDAKFEKENTQKLRDLVSGGTVNEISPYPGQKGYTYLNFTDKNGKNKTVSLKASTKMVKKYLKIKTSQPQQVVEMMGVIKLQLKVRLKPKVNGLLQRIKQVCYRCYSQVLPEKT